MRIRRLKIKKTFVIPMVMGSHFFLAPHFSLANTTVPSADSCKVVLEKGNTANDVLDLDALLRQVGISEEALASASDLKVPVSSQTQVVQNQGTVENTSAEAEAKPRVTFTQAFHADVEMPTRISFTEAEVRDAEKVMGIDRSVEPEGLKGRQANFVKALVEMYNEMDPSAFEAKKSEIQAELRRHNVTAQGELLNTTFLNGALGEIDRAKMVHDIQVDYKKSLREYMIEITKASKQVDIKVGPMTKLKSKIPFFGGKTEEQLYDEAISEFFTEMVPIRTAIEAAVGNVVTHEKKADKMIKELKQVRDILTKLKSDYNTRITELGLLQNAIVDYIENDPVLSQDPKNSLRRYLIVEVIRDIEKTIAVLQNNLGTVSRGIVSNFNNTEELRDAMLDLHHTAQSLKVTLVITTMDTVVQNSVADLINLTTDMNQLILNLQNRNANQTLVNGRKTRKNATAMQTYILNHVKKINETIETNQVERETFKRASIESSRKFIEGMKTHQNVIDELITQLAKAEASGVGASYDPKEDAQYIQKLNLLVEVLNRDRSTMSGELLQKAEDVMTRGMKAMGIRRESLWKITEDELKKQQDALKNQ